MIPSDYKKRMTDNWFSYLQIQICKSFEILEKNKFKFSKRHWHKKNIKEGGGTSYLLTNGKIFDKVGVNKSTVTGIFPKNLDQIYSVLKKQVSIGLQVFLLLLT